MTPQSLKLKLIKYIQQNGEVSFDELWERGTVRNKIDPALLEQAITLLHKDKHWIDTKNKSGTIYYTIHVEKPVVNPIANAQQWVRDNYPWPTKFIMPFPEIDMSWMFLRNEDLERYKAESKGRVYIPGKKKVWERKKKPVESQLSTGVQEQLMLGFEG